MRSHLNQYVFSPLFWVMSLLLVILFLLVVLLFTPIGPRAIAYVADSSLDDLSLKGVSGSVLSGLHVDEFSWNTETSILLKDIDIKINRYDIQNKKLSAKSVSVGVLSINVPDSNNEGSADFTALPNFGLPINIDADSLKLDSLRITENVPGDLESQTLLFQIKDIQLKQATIREGILHFDNLQGNPIILDEPLKINVSDGTMNMNQPHEVKTSGELDFEHPILGSLTGNIQLKGTLTQYLFESDLKLKQKTIGSETLKIIGKGDYTKVNVEKMRLESPHGNAEAKGEIVWNPEIRWAYDVEGKDLTSALLLPEWVVTGDANLKYTGSFIDSRLENQVDILHLEGDFRGSKLTGKGQITERAGLIRAENLNLTLGENRVLITGAVTEPMNIKARINAKSLEQLLPELKGKLVGDASVKGTFKQPEITTKLRVDDLAYDKYKKLTKPLHIDGELSLENDVLKLKKLIAKTGANKINIEGRASEPYQLKWNIDATEIKQFSGLFPADLETNFSGSIKANGVISGTLKKPQTSLKLSASNLSVNEFKQGKESLKVDGNVAFSDGVIQLQKLRASSGGNKLQLTGDVGDKLALKINIDASNLSQVSPDFSGRIQGDGTISGKLAAPIFKTNIVASNLQLKDTRLSGGALNLNAEVQLLDGVPIVKQLNAQLGQNRLVISGRAISPFDLTWDIDSKNLQQVMPEFTGSLIAKGRLQGTIDKPLINAQIDAKQLKYKDFQLSSANFNATTNNGVYRIKGDLKKFRNAEQLISAATLDVNGRIESHSITALVDHEQAKVKLNANGAWQDQKWSGIVQNLQLSDTKAGDWNLQKPTRVSLSSNQFSSEKFCFNNKKTQACSTANYLPTTGISAKGTLRKTSLKLLSPFIPEGVDLNGTVNGSYDIQQNNGKPKGTIKLQFPDSSFAVMSEEGDERLFAYEKAEISATVNNRTIKAKATMEIVNRGSFTANSTIKLSPENGKHTIDGNANFDVPNINFAQELIPHSRGLRGALNSKLTFSGLLSKPQIKGQATIKNGYLRLPEAGTEITKINLKLKADKPGVAKISGKMLMGTGVLTVNGDMNVKDFAKWKANIKLSGNNIRFMNTNEIRASMSPNLTLALSPELVSIKGKVEIPYADIRLKDIPETSVDESDDTFVIGERKAGEQVSAVKVHPNVKIVLGDKVNLNAFGLKAKLAGDIDVTHNKRDILANGSLRVSNGKFRAYGQDLEINNGRLIFNGSPKLVGMDIRATRTLDEQIVGVHLGGTLRNPKSTIFSEPALEESEALSFLLTGHSLSTTSGQESALLMSAVRGLGVTGSGSLVQKIGSSFGLDDVNIVTKEDFKASELALGKRLGSRLYVRYLVGLFDQTQKIAIEYKINKVLSLEAQTTAEDYGLDFIYEIERD